MILLFKKLMTNNHADAKMIGVVIAIFITLIISILLVYTIASSTTFSTATEQKITAARGYPTSGDGMDYYNNSTSAGNSSTDILDQAGTFFQIAPIIGIVIVAVVILGYVGKIGGTGGGT